MREFRGYITTDDGNLVEEELPHIPEGFLLIIDAQNFKFCQEVLRKIFATVGQNFQPLIPSLDETQPFELARRAWLEEVQNLFDSHGMPQIKVSMGDCVRESHTARLQLK